jgi:hypothetical protein
MQKCGCISLLLSFCYFMQGSLLKQTPLRLTLKAQPVTALAYPRAVQRLPRLPAANPAGATSLQVGSFFSKGTSVAQKMLEVLACNIY